MSGYIGVRKVSTLDNASGVWGLSEQAKSRKDRGWPVLDTYFTSTSLLLHCDGENNSTTFVDRSVNSLTVVANNDAKISTAQSKFNGSSLYLDGNGDYLAVANHIGLNLGTGNFTVEFWMRYSGTTNGDPGLFSTLSGWVSGAIAMAIDTGAYPDKISLFVYDYSPSTVLLVSGTLSNNVWHHVAVVRNGTSIAIYIDGDLSSQNTISSGLAFNFNTGSGLVIGLNVEIDANNYYAGYLDEVRITKGIARYTGNFTTQTLPFPDNA